MRTECADFFVASFPFLTPPFFFKQNKATLIWNASNKQLVFVDFSFLILKTSLVSRMLFKSKQGGKR